MEVQGILYYIDIFQDKLDIDNDSNLIPAKLDLVPNVYDNGAEPKKTGLSEPWSILEVGSMMPVSWL